MNNFNKPAPVSGNNEKDIRELNKTVSLMVDELIFLQKKVDLLKKKLEELTKVGT